MWMCFSPRKADGDTVPLLRATMTLMPVSTNGTEKSMISERSSLIVREPMAMSARLYSTWEKRHKQKANKTNTEAQQWASCSGQQFPPLYPTCALLKIEIFTHFTSNPFKTGKPQAASNKWKTFLSSFQNAQGENAASQELSHPSQFFCKAFFTHIHTHTRTIIQFQSTTPSGTKTQAKVSPEEHLFRCFTFRCSCVGRGVCGENDVLAPYAYAWHHTTDLKKSPSKKPKLLTILDSQLSLLETVFVQK